MTGPKPRVIIVDDVAGLRTLLRIILEESGQFDVVGEGEDGRAAVELARVHQPDLALLDLSMPHLDGLEALPLILRASPATKVVVFSGFAQTRMGQQVLELGASDYMEKGAPPEEILERLSAILGVRGDA